MSIGYRSFIKRVKNLRVIYLFLIEFQISLQCSSQLFCFAGESFKIKSDCIKTKNVVIIATICGS
jgi:hypothetical protein